MKDDRSLSTKYRPVTFDDIVGQEAVKTILQRQIEADKLKSAYLLFGKAGTGKTTTARCLARSLNEGTLQGLVEVDAATNSGVDNVRDIIDNSKYKAIGCNKKVYIIDECFHKDTLVNTPDGYVKISDLSKGDTVYNMISETHIEKIHKNVVSTSRTCIVTVGGVEVFTTVDHLFFTTRGWVKAKDLCKQDYILDRLNINRLDDLRMYKGDFYTSCEEFEFDVATQYIINVPNNRRRAVGDVQIYSENNYDKYFKEYITETEKESSWMYLYDLEIYGHPSYYVEGLAVHNCHSLSSAAWQSFLKVIEDGVDSVVFIFCTTEKHKVPATIVSRCQVFDLKTISSDDIRNRLKYIQDSEIAQLTTNGNGGAYLPNVSEDCLDYIAKLADGGMRLAISYYEKILDYNNNPTLEEVSKILGTASYDNLYKLLEAVYDRKASDLVRLLESMQLDGGDFKLVMKDFVDFILELLKYELTLDTKLTKIPDYYIKSRPRFNDKGFLLDVIDATLNSTTEIKKVENPKNYMLGKLLQLC